MFVIPNAPWRTVSQRKPGVFRMKLSQPTGGREGKKYEGTPRQRILHLWLCQSTTPREIDNSFTFLTACDSTTALAISFLQERYFA
jgi:hypothetical protein